MHGSSETRRNREQFYKEMRRVLERAYLAGEDPRAQSGFRGDAARWERARRVIVEAVDRDGTFLDVGCANGHLMECVVEWGRAKGLRIEPYGVDLSPKLVALAQRRLPQRADHIFIGNALDWTPPMRFDFVRTELVYVPEVDQREFVGRLLTNVVAPSGRLIIAAYRGRHDPLDDTLADLSTWGFTVRGNAESHDLDGMLLTRVAWIDAPN
jgi:SAM-dependent methyltransferase